MVYWIFIIIGTILLSLSLSQKFYLLIFKNINIMNNLFNRIFIKLILFILGFLLIFFGLFIESIY